MMSVGWLGWRRQFGEATTRSGFPFFELEFLNTRMDSLAFTEFPHQGLWGFLLFNLNFSQLLLEGSFCNVLESFVTWKTPVVDNKYI